MCEEGLSLLENNMNIEELLFSRFCPTCEALLNLDTLHDSIQCEDCDTQIPFECKAGGVLLRDSENKDAYFEATELQQARLG